uniref:Rho GTPase activating protein 5 n=1 Tax=Mandrillus leucophaeus TaxID=9568 RepID=A0A2K5Z627_MANLE
MMAKNKEPRPPSYTISVVGLSGTEKDKGNYGVGKSYLSNRFVRAKADEYYPEHTSVLSPDDFGGRVVNNDHFLYYWDGVECKIHFIDDQAFLSHRSTNLQPYIKRAASAGKLMYICTDQLGLEQDFEQKQMPEGKLNVDGFLLRIDVSQGCNRKFDDQLKFANNLFVQLSKSKIPVIIAATKCDECMDHYLREVQAFASNKKNLLLVEISTGFNVNIETRFTALVQMLDKTRSKPKIIPYLDAYKTQRQLAVRATDKSEKLVQTVRDYHATWKTISNKLKNHPDYEEYINLEGTRKYINTLPRAFNTLLPNLEEIEHLNWSEALKLMEKRADFQLCFVIPFDLLSTLEAEKLYQNHVQHLISEKRKVEMKEKFKKTLEKIQFISPGQPWEEVMCFVMEDEAFKYITEADSNMVEMVEKAKEDSDKKREIHTVLSEEPGYKALQKLAPDRDSLLPKHIGFVYHSTKETCLSGQNCTDIKVEQLLARSLLQLDHGRLRLYHDSTNIDKVNLFILGKVDLAQELANEIKHSPLKVSISPYFLSQLWTATFKPHGCFCVFNSIESLSFIGHSISKNPPILRHQGQQLANKLQCPFVDVPAGTYACKFDETQIKQALRVLESVKHNLDVVSPVPANKDILEVDLRIVMCAMCGDPFSVDLILSPFFDSHSCSAAQAGQNNSLMRLIQITILSYRSSIGVRKDELVQGYILVYSAKRKTLVAVTDSQLMTEGEYIATEITATFTALYSLSQYHRQTEIFILFFSDVLEKKHMIENSYLSDNARESTHQSEDVFLPSPRDCFPYNNYPDSDDDTEAPPPYSPTGDDVQLLPTPSDYLEGNECPILSTPNCHDHERNHKVPPPIKSTSVVPKTNQTSPVPLAHPEDMDPSDNYTEPIDKIFKQKGYSDEIYVVPDDSQNCIKIQNSFVNNTQGHEENGFSDRTSKNHGERRPSKYKYKSKTLFSKAKSCYRRTHSDASDDEVFTTSKTKRKGRHHGSEEDPLLSPVETWKGDIDNPEITSDQELDDKKMKKKTRKVKEDKKQKKKTKNFNPPTHRNRASDYFGMPFQDLVTAEKPIPVFVEKHVEFIEDTGLCTEGLYHQFDQDHNINLVSMEIKVNAKAGALTAFFADLTSSRLKEIVKKFHPVNYDEFRYMITHLNRISQQNKINLMTADNLSICFWSILMRPDFLSTTKIHQPVCQFFFYNGEIVETTNTVAPPPPSNPGQLVEPTVPLQLLPPLQPQLIQP